MQWMAVLALALALLVYCALKTRQLPTSNFKLQSQLPAHGPRPSGPFMGAELELE